MEPQENIDFKRVAGAIDYLQKNFKNQPSLEEVASDNNLSPHHFQRIFTSWAGVSPKKFVQFLSVDHAKKLLRDDAMSLFDTAYYTGLSGTGRLHDLFIGIEGMTPGEYKNGGQNLSINYSYAESRFGWLIVASTHKGVSHLEFSDDDASALANLKKKFPNAKYTAQKDEFQQNAIKFFNEDRLTPESIRLHLKGTPFQIKVWEALLKIPAGGVSTYGFIARKIDSPNGSRAVGSAVGDNPVAYLIPCHRVILSSGVIGQYHWGKVRKAAMIGWEMARYKEIKA